MSCGNKWLHGRTGFMSVYFDSGVLARVQYAGGQTTVLAGLLLKSDYECIHPFSRTQIYGKLTTACSYIIHEQLLDMCRVQWCFAYKVCFSGEVVQQRTWMEAGISQLISKTIACCANVSVPHLPMLQAVNTEDHRQFSLVTDTLSSFLVVTLFKCSISATDCSECLAVLPIQKMCGWCNADLTCNVQEECAANWNGGDGSECPEPLITGFSPPKGPIEGGTKLTIEGSNLGVTFADIGQVTVNELICDLIEKEYAPGKTSAYDCLLCLSLFHLLILSLGLYV